MRMRTVLSRTLIAFAAALAVSSAAFGDVQIVNGQKWECADGQCRLIGPADEAEIAAAESAAPAAGAPEAAAKPPRIAMGYLTADAFVSFLRGEGGEDDLADRSGWVILLVALLGGLMLNLTPCVLPMIPVNIAIIGRSAARGAWYGLGIMLAYGAMCFAAAAGGLAFGEIQSSPWFNLAAAVVFVALGLSLCGLFSLDFSRYRSSAVASSHVSRASFLFPLVLGALSAVLAGACVAPVLISVLFVATKLYFSGNMLALALPFALGLGMALPWPFLGAGMKVLPKPGAWTRWVNRAFAAFVLCLAAWYAVLAASPSPRREAPVGVNATTLTFADALGAARKAGRPVLVDCWAPWCKNCTVMEATTLADPKVRAEMERFSVIRLEVDDFDMFRALPGFGDIMGIPAFVVFE